MVICFRRNIIKYIHTYSADADRRRNVYFINAIQYHCVSMYIEIYIQKTVEKQFI